MQHTRNCLCCGRPATKWCGHVHRACELILAGFCRECTAAAEQNRVTIMESRGYRVATDGCYGGWQEADGILEE